MIRKEEISIQKRYLVVDATTNWKFYFSDGEAVTWFQGRYEIDLYKYVADSRSIQRPYLEWDDEKGRIDWQVSDVSVGELSGVNGQLVYISNPSLEVKVINTPSVDVTNQPNVRVINEPVVNVGNQPGVNVVNTPGVNVANWPSVINVQNARIKSIGMWFDAGSSSAGLQLIGAYWKEIRARLGYPVITSGNYYFYARVYGSIMWNSKKFYMDGDTWLFQGNDSIWLGGEEEDGGEGELGAGAWPMGATGLCDSGNGALVRMPLETNSVYINNMTIFIEFLCKEVYQ